MKKILLVCCLTVLFYSYGHAQEKYTISNEGLTYSPAEITVNVGDTVMFNVGSFHPTLQVSEETWNANGTDPLQGGFDFPGGTGTIVIVNTNTIYYVCTSHVSSGMKGVIMVNQTSGLTGTSGEKYFEIYPNPVTNGIVNIQFDGKYPDDVQIKIYDLTGKEVAKSFQIDKNMNSNGISIQVGSLKAGVYILEIKGDGFTEAAKLMVN